MNLQRIVLVTFFRKRKKLLFSLWARPATQRPSSLSSLFLPHTAQADLALGLSPRVELTQALLFPSPLLPPPRATATARPTGAHRRRHELPWPAPLSPIHQ
jgi:hypothetical protein